jgi:hypothetical protein
MYQGKPNINTRRLVVEEGGFLYDSDCYSDDLPFWNMDYGRPHLVIPYTLDVNDMRFATPQGFNCGDQFFTYLKVWDWVGCVKCDWGGMSVCVGVWMGRYGVLCTYYIGHQTTCSPTPPNKPNHTP